MDITKISDEELEQTTVTKISKAMIVKRKERLESKLKNVNNMLAVFTK